MTTLTLNQINANIAEIFPAFSGFSCRHNTVDLFGVLSRPGLPDLPITVSGVDDLLNRPLATAVRVATSRIHEAISNEDAR
jgi:hypothetical protein